MGVADPEDHSLLGVIAQTQQVRLCCTRRKARPVVRVCDLRQQRPSLLNLSLSKVPVSDPKALGGNIQRLGILSK
jgi:hypothetical protein